MRRVPVLVVLLASLTSCGRPAGDPVDVVGTWQSQTPGVALELATTSFRFESGRLTKWGTLVRTPFRMAFVLERTSSPAFNLYCREEVDVYDWFLEEEVLTFRAVGRPCDRAAQAVLVAGEWRRVAR
jgi:hypothetical protein